ncbi:hypothetical protein KY362_00485 [Candidatus Woesearchaeota archaeon]|nr:hypothetical protein [Candidatus Woesearchaeota archaeon]
MVVLVALAVGIKFLGKLASMLFTVVGIFLVVWLVVIGLRYMDEENVRENFMLSNNLFVLEENGNPLTGFVTKDGLPGPELDTVLEEVENPNSELYDEYYKVVFVDKEALPEKIQLVMDAADPEDRLSMFQEYVETEIIEGDTAENLIEKEKAGDIEVYHETLAFRHGFMDVLGS